MGAGAGGGASTQAPQVTLQQVQALSLTWTDRLHLAVGCARGLAALHTFSTDLCHRDIKSFNFLIDSQLNAKISDLELGMAELLNHNSGRRQRAKRPSTATSTSAGNGSESIGNASEMADSEQSSPSLASNDILANWSAPEVIQGLGYTQASDVYGFALVLWEILVGRVPFSEVKRQDDIRRKVLAGGRPLIPACFITGEQAAMFAPYISLIQRGWDQDPLQRPSILTILAELEDLQHNSMQRLISTTDATQNLDEGYVKNLTQQSTRTGSITADDPMTSPSFLPSVLAGAAAGASAHGPAGMDDSVHNRPSQAAGMSFSRPSSNWFQGSFMSPKSPFGSGQLQPGQGRFGSAGVEGHAISPAHQVLENLRSEDDGAALHALEASGGCHVLVLPVPPHEVVWATHAWCLMSGCDVSDIVGKPLHTLPIFDSSSFVRIKSGSQPKGSLAAELLETPKSTLGDLWNACTAVLFGTDHNPSAAAENAAATSLFFKSLHCRYLHRARSSHAVINVLDFSSRTWNMSASQRTANTLSRRFVKAVTGRRGSAMLSADSGATAPGQAGSAVIDNTVPAICSSFSVHAYPVYQRTVVSSPVPIPTSNAGSAVKSRSGFFHIGSLGKPR
jgi:serine/threonine protein kinase